MGENDHGPRIDHIIIGAKDVNKAADHIFKVMPPSRCTACMHNFVLLDRYGILIKI